MTDWIRSLFSRFSNGMYLPDIQIKDVVEILIITVIVYEIMLWIKNTKAWMLLRGIIMLGLFILLAWIFQMHTILFLAGQCISVLATAAVVVFQPELRRALEKLGEKNLFSNINLFDRNKENQRFSDETGRFWVKKLQMPVELEDTVWALRPGGFSRPFFTPQGIHIVKVLERKNFPSFEEMREKIALDEIFNGYSSEE